MYGDGPGAVRGERSFVESVAAEPCGGLGVDELVQRWRKAGWPSLADARSPSLTTSLPMQRGRTWRKRTDAHGGPLAVLTIARAGRLRRGNPTGRPGTLRYPAFELSWGSRRTSDVASAMTLRAGWKPAVPGGSAQLNCSTRLSAHEPPGNPPTSDPREPALGTCVPASGQVASS